MTICDATLAVISDAYLELTPEGFEKWMTKRLDQNSTYGLVWSAYLAGTADEQWFKDHATATS